MRIGLVYQVVCYWENEDSEEYARTFYEALLTKTLLKPCLHKSIEGRLRIHFMVWELMVPNGTHDFFH